MAAEALATGDKVTDAQIAATGEVRKQKRREAAITAGVANDAVTLELANGQALQQRDGKAEADTQKWVDEARARTSVAQQRLDSGAARVLLPQR